MDFEHMLNDDMMVAVEKIETGQTKHIEMTAEELETIIRQAVREEINQTVNDAIGRLEKKLTSAVKNHANQQETSSTVSVQRKQEKISVDARRLANSYDSMQCGGWVYYPNEQEGKHLLES
ncbi:hypothetical protein GH808_03740 [Acetobacterium fimetarium]|uniref:Uncharacterized protein n=1 Tax=Acetobacterium fimetarium TaxID=52691 RepID=A0ABR6WT30_9FIRM|nr:hypothetical protein [Acetobacterium fimetarium]MBC3803548.1 hypothetical protein [Acetobacterium fimetarium]